MDIIFSTILRDLRKAVKTEGHPFRYFTLATSDEKSLPRLRTVVLREVDENLNIIVYTDRRSQKISHIHHNDRVGLLFFDSNKSLQISILANVEIIRNDRILNAIWKQISRKSRKDYTKEHPPGKEIKDPSEIEYLKNDHYFSALKIIPEQIEYLRLKRPNHIRVLFKKEKNEWKGSYLVP